MLEALPGCAFMAILVPVPCARAAVSEIVALICVILIMWRSQQRDTGDRRPAWWCYCSAAPGSTRSSASVRRQPLLARPRRHEAPGHQVAEQRPAAQTRQIASKATWRSSSARDSTSTAAPTRRRPKQVRNQSAQRRAEREAGLLRDRQQRCSAILVRAGAAAAITRLMMKPHIMPKPPFNTITAITNAHSQTARKHDRHRDQTNQHQR